MCQSLDTAALLLQLAPSGPVWPPRYIGISTHQIKMLLWDMKCSGVKPSKPKNGLSNETNETCLHSTTQEEPLEVLGLDEIYK